MNDFIATIPPAIIGVLILAAVFWAASLVLLTILKTRSDREESVRAKRAAGIRERLDDGQFEMVAQAMLPLDADAIRALHTVFVDHPNERDRWASELVSQPSGDTVYVAVIQGADAALASGDHGMQRICDDLIRFLPTTADSYEFEDLNSE